MYLHTVTVSICHTVLWDFGCTAWLVLQACSGAAATMAIARQVPNVHLNISFEFGMLQCSLASQLCLTLT